MLARVSTIALTLALLGGVAAVAGGAGAQAPVDSGFKAGGWTTLLQSRGGSGGDGPSVVIERGEVFVAVGTRDSQEAAIIFAREYQHDFPSVAVARLVDGKWATMIGWVEQNRSGSLVDALRGAGRIPNGSFVVNDGRVDAVQWTAAGALDRDRLRIADNAPRTPLLSGLGITGRWGSNAQACNVTDPAVQDLLSSPLELTPRSMRWGSFGQCSFGSIVRVNGGVYLDATCGTGKDKDSFVVSLRRANDRLTLITDPTLPQKLSYEFQLCSRPVSAGPAGIDTPRDPTPRPRTAALPGPSSGPNGPRGGGGGAGPFGDAPAPDGPDTPSGRGPRTDDRSSVGPNVAAVPRTGGAPRAGGGGGGGDDPDAPDTPRKPGERKVASTGSGFFITSDGHIVTNEHVVKACAELKVEGFGVARLIKADSAVDLALLKVEPTTPVPVIKVRATPARLGQDIVVFGFPLTSILNNGLNVTTGIISSETGLNNDKNMLQFSAGIQPGNSGGPVVDRAGNLVAVVRSKLNDKLALEKGSFVPQNLNFGVKVAVLMTFLEKNAVVAEKAADDDKERSVADLAAAARERTLLISCLK